MFYLDIYSTFNNGTYNYTWQHIEVPVNTLGLPDGTVSLSTPTTDDTQEDVYYTGSSGGLEEERPIVPTITFTYVGVGTIPTNDCESINPYTPTISAYSSLDTLQSLYQSQAEDVAHDFGVGVTDIYGHIYFEKEINE